MVEEGKEGVWLKTTMAREGHDLGAVIDPSLR